MPLDLGREKFSRAQDSLLKKVSINFSENGLTIGKKDKKASFIDITVKDQSELFAFWMIRYLVEEATHLYLDLKVGKMKRSVIILQKQGRFSSAHIRWNHAFSSIGNRPKYGFSVKCT